MAIAAASLGTAAAQTERLRVRSAVQHRPVERRDAVDRSGDVAKQDDRVVVALVDGNPRERAVVSIGPLGEDRRLPRACRCHKRYEWMRLRCPQAVDDRGARDAARPRRRDEHLGVHMLERKLSIGVDGHLGEYQADPEAPQECVHHSSRVLPAVCTPPDHTGEKAQIRCVSLRQARREYCGRRSWSTPPHQLRHSRTDGKRESQR